MCSASSLLIKKKYARYVLQNAKCVILEIPYTS